MEEEEPPGSRSHDRYAEWDDLATIAAVETALLRHGDVIRLHADDDFPARLRAERPDIIFNIAEGLNGPTREAQVPAICEFFGIPYTGSDPLALGLALDKRRTKEILRVHGVATPAFVAAGDGAGPLASVRLPAIVKPLHEGSSKGIDRDSVCSTMEAVTERVRSVVTRYSQPALVEEFLAGREFTCAILGNGDDARVLPIVELNFDALPADAPRIYGWEAKWVWDDPQRPIEIFRCPADVCPDLANAIASTALGAFRALGCRDWSRIDLRLDARGTPHVLEVNPLPGILPDPSQHSCFPMAAYTAGYDYDGMIGAVLSAALQRYGMQP